MDGETYVLVPEDEYDQLVAKNTAADALANLADKDRPDKWIDADDFGRQLAGERIASARKAAGLTQKQLAARLNVPQSQISRIERNPDHTTVRTLKRVAKALHVDVSALV
jgi:ribosome-binding protein aMBF1 (putative translation factor)